MVGTPPSLPSTSTILILDIDQESYHFAELPDDWQEVLKGMHCPACRSDRLGHHSSYQKYLYEQRISILRLRCRGCGRTHAVIPSWSLPDTSVGTAEVERYLLARERGVSRAVALEELLARGMHDGYGKQLERRLDVIVSRGKALWPQSADPQLGGLAWIRTACAPRPAATPLLSLNHFCLEHRVNALCCSRISILLLSWFSGFSRCARYSRSSWFSGFSRCSSCASLFPHCGVAGTTGTGRPAHATRLTPALLPRPLPLPPRVPLERTLQLPGSGQRQRTLLKLLLYFRVIRTQLLGLDPVVGRAPSLNQPTPSPRTRTGSSTRAGGAARGLQSRSGDR